VDRRIITYGFSPQADIRADRVITDRMGATFEVAVRDRATGRTRNLKPMRLPMLGHHNVQNALAAIAIACEMDVDEGTIRTALLGFKGVKRRFTRVGETGGVTIIDDYGHHPAEIRAVLDAARAVFASRRLVVAFQPHRYSRTHFLLQDFATSFNLVEKLYVTDIYAASEDPIPGVSGEVLAAQVREHGHRDANYVALDQLVEALATTVQPGDVVFTLGAGTITQIGPQLEARLRAGARQGSGRG
jgi:UDP-N-acetylmuramate--alanine ligase